ncbi:heparinase II/III family protein [Aureimonas sp. SK2]|uniref:heparinase II/III family protein n=1 Tax=Aureimonas sp. SK2 TaxID=3015992 RepID=UPI0024446914|nr:heparinase II/III family protein [Aureimonas sp. SK2]
MTTGFVDEPRLAGLMAREIARRAVARLRALLRHPLPFAASGTGLPVATLTDMRRGDPSVARGFYVGHVWLAGQLVELNGRSPFSLKDEARPWRVELHGFGWLRHFARAGDALSCEHARSLVGDWLRLPRRQRGALAYEHEVAAARVLAWISHAPTILSGADAAFCERFARGLSIEVRHLRRTASSAPAGLPRLKVRIALVAAALVQPAGAGTVRQAARFLGEELDAQVHADGGHVSRNPAAVSQILAELVPLRALFADQGLPAPRAVFGAVDRMLPALRFFRHGDGAQALFNGAGAVDHHLSAALLAHDETLGEPISQMRQSGYHRLAAGLTVVLADTGLPPAPDVSHEAHAGTLALEFSSGGRRMVVNCGSPVRIDGGWRRLSRTTAAHSTLTLNDQSSSRFSRSEAVDRFLGGPLLPGPTRVPVNREETHEGQLLTAAHDGYRQAFGFVHERQIFLSRDGRRIEGIDRLFQAAGRVHRMACDEPMGTLRFHLHPDVQVDQGGGGLRLVHGEEFWWFFADGEPQLEESIFFADAAGPRRTRQIVLPLDCLDRTDLNWRFERQG